MNQGEPLESRLLFGARSSGYASRHRHRGAALVIVLAFVVLFTAFVVAYFSRALFSRKLSDSSINQARAEALARSAADIVVADLKQEIADPNASTAVTVSGVTIYTPKSPANIVPMRSAAVSALTGDNKINNLIRISSATVPPAPAVDTAPASSAPSTTASANGRTFTAARWNSHYLIPLANASTISSSDTDTNPIGSFANVTPSWVFVTNQGPTVLSTPSTSVIGRYAYAVYDEGGLLDMNAAGYPSSTTAAQSGSKGSLAFADLTQLPYPILQSPDIDTIVGWRNHAITRPGGSFGNFDFDASAATRYYDYMLNIRSGFMTTSGLPAFNGRTDQRFPSRQALLAFRRATGFSQNALQYMGTFSRSVNSPTWGPTTPAGSTSDYATLASTPSPESSVAVNRNLPNVRVQAPFTRADGTMAKVGEPLLKTRFPLSRLAGLGYVGIAAGGNTTVIDGAPSPATPATIRRDFGLIWAGSQWNYVGATGNTIQGEIKTLDQVAAENREPNFFELLKAGILSGSLGKQGYSLVNRIDPSTLSPFTSGGLDSEVDNQIIQIGANAIDQADTDSYPTSIAFNSNYSPVPVLHGVENLPGLVSLSFTPYRYNANRTVDGVDYVKPDIGFWIKPVVWNPHANAAAMLSTHVGPTQFRFVVNGTSTWQLHNSYNQYYLASEGIQLLPHAGPATTQAFSDSDPGLVFNYSGAGDFSEPTNLSSPASNAVAVGKDNQVAVSPASSGFVGVWCGDIFAPDLLQNPRPYPVYESGPMEGDRILGDAANAALAPVNEWIWTRFTSAAGLTCKLQYQDASGAWRDYNAMRWITVSGEEKDNWRDEGGYPGDPARNAYQQPRMIMLNPRSDPRTDRFGSMSTFWSLGIPLTDSAFTPLRIFPTLRPGTSKGLQAHMGPPLSPSDPMPPGWTFEPSVELVGSNSAYLGALTDNQASGSTHYRDPDGVLRLADGGYVSAATGTAGYPMIANNTVSRPVMLDRPFRSVGELGFVHRGMPWKTLDLFTANSADAALLDLFSVGESPAVVAGTVNLNTRQQPVLQAVLAGALKNTLQSPSGITSADLTTLLAGIATVTDVTPLVDRSELATKIGPALNYALPNPDNASKPQREAAVRALGDVANTRTWNLLIDVVAQSGRFTSSASNLDQFMVEGECRYWLHVAIDRYTGKVVDKSLEIVNE